MQISIMTDFTLGLDLGTNSIGWAVIEEDAHGQAVGLLDCSVRIFQEPSNFFSYLKVDKRAGGCILDACQNFVNISCLPSKINPPF